MVERLELVRNMEQTTQRNDHSVLGFFPCKLLTFALTWLLSINATSADEPLVVDELIVTLIDSVEVPSAETGIVAELLVQEGHAVTNGQTIAKLDDRKAIIEQSLMTTQLEITQWRAEHDRTVNLAEKKLAEEQQRAKQQSILLEIAKRKGENGVRVEASSKAEAVAKNELDRAIQARLQFVDSVSKSEIDGLRLSHEKSRLETRQAGFERELDALNATAETEAAHGLELAVDRSQIELAQTQADKKLSELQVLLHQQQATLAELTVSKLRVASPLDGVVVELYRKAGDWVTAGEPIARVIRVNRLRAEGFVPLSKLQRLRNNRDVTLSIVTGSEDHSSIERDGKIVFINPEVDVVNGEVAFWVEFENPNVDVLPGMRLGLKSKVAREPKP